MNPITKARKAKQAKQPKPSKPSPSDNGEQLRTEPPAEKPGERKLRVSPPYVPFPIDCLPGRMGEYVSEASDVMGCDPAQIALPMLAIAGGLVGNLRKIRLKQTWQEAPIIWAVVVADSSSTKSPAFKLIEKPLVDLQVNVNKTNNPRDLFIADCTIEHVGTVLEKSQRGTILAMDELTAWFSGFTRYRKTGSDVPIWCQLWQCGTYKKDRADIDKKNVFVPNACCSVTGTMTPGNLATVLSTPGLFETGLLFRPLFAMPPSRNECWDEREMKPKTISYWSKRCEMLLGFEGDPICLHPDDAAKKAWVDYYDAVRDKIHMSPLLVRGALIKLRAYTARFALLNFLLGAPDCSPGLGRITADNMIKAIKLSAWFADEADRVFLLRGESEDGRELRDLADAIMRKGGKVTARELQRSNNRRWPTKEIAVQSLHALAAAGYGTVDEDGASTVFHRYEVLPGGLAESSDEVPADPPPPETASAAAPADSSEGADGEDKDTAPADPRADSSDGAGPHAEIGEPAGTEDVEWNLRLMTTPTSYLDAPLRVRRILLEAGLTCLRDVMTIRPWIDGDLAASLAGRFADLSPADVARVVDGTNRVRTGVKTKMCRRCIRFIGIDPDEQALCSDCAESDLDILGRSNVRQGDWRDMAIGDVGGIPPMLCDHLVRQDVLTLGHLDEALEAQRLTGLKPREAEKLRALVADAKTPPPETIPIKPPEETVRKPRKRKLG